MVFKDVLGILFNPALIQQDDTQGEVLQNEEKGRLQLGGLGSSANTKGKYEGFGSSPLNREGNVLHVHGIYPVIISIISKHFELDDIGQREFEENTTFGRIVELGMLLFPSSMHFFSVTSSLFHCCGSN